MKALKTIFVMIIVFASAPLLADVRYRAGYEINFSDGGKNGWSIATRSWLSTVEPLVHEFGQYKVSMLLADVSDTTYSIIITVNESGGSMATGEVLKQSFEGSLTGILEFSSENSLISIDGAIAINRLGN